MTRWVTSFCVSPMGRAGTVARTDNQGRCSLSDRAGLTQLSGVVPGEQVVVRGNERLRPGQSITVGEPEVAEEAAGES